MTAPLRFHLAVDDGGEYLVAFGSSLVVGHPRNRAAELPLLADIAPEHAALVFTPDSFHEGAHWSLEPRGAPAGAIRINGASLSTRRRLVDGDLVALSSQLALRVRLPDPASSSAVLELERGVECLGAQRILLFAPGAGGRIHVGRRTVDHVRIPRMETEISVEIGADGDGHELAFACPAGLQIAGGEPAPRHNLACPPRERVDLVLAVRPERGGPPFAVSVAPLDRASTRTGP